MTLNPHITDLSNYEGPNIKHKKAKRPSIPAHGPSVEKKKYDPSQATFKNMEEKKGYKGRILEQDLEKKESGCCSIM